MSMLVGLLCAALTGVLCSHIGCCATRMVRLPKAADRRDGPSLRRSQGFPSAIRPPRAVQVVEVLTRWRQRRIGVAPDSVAAWCDALSRQVRSGVALREAMRVEIPIDPLVADLTNDLRHRIDRGQPLVDVVKHAHVDLTIGNVAGHAHVAFVYSIVESVTAVGGSAATPLDRVASALRLRSADGQERIAHSAQARLSAHVLTTVPLLMLAVLAGTNPEVRLVLAGPAGAASLCAGLTLNLGGWWWMRRIIRGRH